MEEVRRPDAPPFGGWPMWTGIFAGPVAWLVGLEASYALVPIACAHTGRWPVHLVQVIEVAICIVGLLAARRSLRAVAAAGPGGDERAYARTRFLSWLGILLSALFALSALAQGATTLFLGACPP